MVTLRSGLRTKKDGLSEINGMSNGQPMATSLHDEADTLLASASNNDNNLKGTEPNKKSSMQKILFFSLILDLLGFTVILPLFPALLDYYSKNDSSGLYQRLLGAVSVFQNYLGVPSRFNSVLFGGLLGSLFSFLQFLSSPMTGALSDVYGRRPIFICTLVGVAISYGMWAAASNFAVFVAARIIGGLSKGNVSLAYTIMTDISHRSNRAKGMALIGVAFSIGFIIGPAIGAGFSKWGSSGWFASSAIYALILAVLNILFFTVAFKETLPQSQRSKSLKSGISGALMLINPVSLFSFHAVEGLDKAERSRLSWLGCVYFLYLFLYSGLEFTLTFVTHLHHHYTSIDQAKMFIFIGITMALVQGGFVRRMKTGSDKNLAIAGFLIMIPSFGLIGMSESSFMFYLGLALYSIGSSVMVPCLTALASLNGPESQKGTVLGIWRSLGALARALGPVVTSAGFWYLGAGYCYCLGGALLIFPLLMLRAY